MKKFINRGFIYISIIITIISIYILPCHKISEFHKSFGYPFGCFTVFNDSIGDIIITSTQTNLLLFLLILLYGIL